MALSTTRALRHRRRTRKRALGAILVVLGVLLWVSAVILESTTEDMLDSLLYLGITVGGGAVVGGIILFATTL
jgi:drug/metabolite transporter (DMT)-like permease